MLQKTGTTMSQKPASRIIAKGLLKGSNYVGQFALPGLVPDMVRDSKGGTATFPTEREAEIAAKDAVVRLFDSRTVDTRKAGGYVRLTGAELAILLDQANVTPTYFAELAGVPQSRVMKWLDGEQDIPHSVHVLIKLIVMNDANFEMAQKITEETRDIQ